MVQFKETNPFSSHYCTVSVAKNSFSILEYRNNECLFFAYLVKDGTNYIFNLYDFTLMNIIYTERKKKCRVEFFPSYFNHFLRCLL